MSWPHVPDDPEIDRYGQDAGYCEECGEHLDSGRCECPEFPCDVCEREMGAWTETGCCTRCEIEWAAAHQLMDRPPHAGELSQAKALAGIARTIAAAFGA